MTTSNGLKCRTFIIDFVNRLSLLSNNIVSWPRKIYSFLCNEKEPQKMFVVRLETNKMWNERPLLSASYSSAWLKLKIQVQIQNSWGKLSNFFPSFFSCQVGKYVWCSEMGIESIQYLQKFIAKNGISFANFQITLIYYEWTIQFHFWTTDCDVTILLWKCNHITPKECRFSWYCAGFSRGMIEINEPCTWKTVQC